MAKPNGEPAMTDAAAAAAPASATEAQKLRLVIAASATGAAFEWYDFFVYSSVIGVMTPLFFAGLPDAQAFIFSLLTFAVSFVVRPVGALIFGRIGDSVGRKGAFLITITVMGFSTFAIGLLPTAQQVGIWAPVLLVACRVLQGIALGGEYGGAAVYVTEHAAPDKRGRATAWVQTSAALGLAGALAVVLATRSIVGETTFAAPIGGWRIPYLASIALLAVSVWIRLQLEESPVFQKLKDEKRVSRRAFAETFLEWRNVKLMLLALLGVMMAQGVVWYTAHIYTQTYLERTLKIPSLTVNLIMITVVIISAPLYIFFSRLSDRIGRKPVLLGGMLLMLVAYFPGFHLLTGAASPALAAASRSAPVTVVADPQDCSFQLDLTGGATQFASSCDIAKSALASAGVSYRTEDAPAGSMAVVRVGDKASVTSVDARSGGSVAAIKAARAPFDKALRAALDEAGYPKAAAGFDLTGRGLGGLFQLYANKFGVFAVLIVFIIAATALYGPQAAALVELFPTRIRYTALSFPYHVGTGWFGGLLPAIVFAINTATGDAYAGLWFPFIVTAVAAATCFLWWPETRGRDITG
jgi:predicted MFS family arabinose efflux permease